MIGQTVGNYTVRALIGQGGMGSVYLAEHIAIGRQVAIKVLLPEMSNDPKLVARFFNEARAATAVRHPGIVEIFDSGMTPDGAAFIVMELLAGETLSARRRKTGRVDPRTAMAIVRQIASALAAAHDAGIVHRDLKPDNVFLVPDPEGDRVKVLDFGIAKLQNNQDDLSRTRTGAVMGTPTYMSPEQCRGGSHIDARADLYALGCVAYELLTGQTPFTATGAGDQIAHHLYFVPQTLRQLDSGLPESIDRLVMWLLQKEPAQRPVNARILIDAIDALGLEAAHFPRAVSQPVIAAQAPNLPTTLSGAAGSTSPGQPPRRRWVVPAVAATTVIVAGIGFIAAVTRDETRKPEPGMTVVTAPPPAPAPPPTPAAAPTPAPAPPPPPTPAPVAHEKLTIESDPAGATVSFGGKDLGVTPYVDDVVPWAEPRVYTLQKTGYEPATTDGTHKVVLKKKRAPTAHTPQGVGDKGVNPFE